MIRIRLNSNKWSMQDVHIAAAMVGGAAWEARGLEGSVPHTLVVDYHVPDGLPLVDALNFLHKHGKPIVTYRHYRYKENESVPESGPPDESKLWSYFRGARMAWKPHARGGLTVCSIEMNSRDTRYYFEGEALCSNSDNFCYATGREIALNRALADIRSGFPRKLLGGNAETPQKQSAGLPRRVGKSAIREFFKGREEIPNPVTWKDISTPRPAPQDWWSQHPDWDENTVEKSIRRAVRNTKMVEDSLRDEVFIQIFNELAAHTHEEARSKGFWGEGESRNDAELIALMHSELSEALEALRAGNPPDDKIPAFSSVEAELADVIIRIMDAAHARDWGVAEAILEKMAYNAGRAHKHGKAF